MLDDVLKLLESFGYTAVEGDNWVLKFVMEKVQKHIKTECGIYDSKAEEIVIPTELHETAVEMAAAEFLMYKKSTGQLTGFDFDSAVKSVQEGDTKVDFAGKTPESRIDLLLTYLLKNGNKKIASHRCIQW